ncbi:MAG TPA: GNAT family N-acetyltransferase [Candidatus Nanopelagicales bacterium]|nr:GNAT family N-acetyltransferase [Candidatus Nanopelagicales bacterium]
MPIPRELMPDDATSLLAVAAACEQTGIQSVTDDAYRSFLRGTGRILVSGREGDVRAYAGLRPHRGAAYLTDLFVHPHSRDQGHGRALLAALWDGVELRMTSSSQDPRALSGYARYGALPRFPLLYLRMPPAPAPGLPVVETPFVVGDAGWPVATPSVSTFRVLDDDGGTVTTAVVHRDGDRLRVLRASTPDPEGAVLLARALADLCGPDGRVVLAVPGPHPALPMLLGLGARIGDTDLWCASPGADGLVDPVHELPSPGLG